MKDNGLNNGRIRPKGISLICTLFASLAIILASSAGNCFAASVSWINPSGGNWNDSANWSTGTVPSTNDDVAISMDGTYSVTLSSSISVANLTIGGGAGTQTLFVQNATIDANTVNKSNIILHGTTSFTVLENQPEGKILVEAIYGAHADLKVVNGPDFKNYGEIQLTTNTTAGYTSQMSIPGDTWVNNGTIRSHAGANGGNRVITGPLDNQGAIQVDYPLQIGAGLTTATVTNDGLIKIADGINFQFTSGLFNPGTGTIEGVFNLNSTASLGSGTLSGTGRMVLANGTINGPLVNRGLLITRGNTRINGSVENQAEGVILIEAVYGAHATLEVVNGPDFKNYGEIQLTTNTTAGYTSKLAITAATWINNGTVKSLVGANGGGRVIAGPLDNQGVIQVDYPLQIGEAPATVTNSGMIYVSGGNLTVAQASFGASFVNSGNISIEAGRRVDINGGFFIPSSGIISSSMVGQGQFYVNSATVASGTISDSAVVVMTNSRTGGLLYNDGTIHARGSCTFDGRFENQFGGTILVEAVYGAHADLKVANGPDFKNYGEIQLTTNTTAGYTSQMSIPGDTWINNGTVRSHAGANGGWRTITGPLDNQGTIQVDYPLQIGEAFAIATVTNNGLIKITDGINFQFTGGIFNPGTGAIEGVFNLNSTASLGSGALSGTGRMVLANGTISGPLVNRGLLITHGNTRINGIVENQAEGTILIEAIYGAHATLEVVNGPDFKNYGEIQLTTNTTAGYTSKLAITAATWINNGTVKSLVGANGGGRVIAGPLDNQGVIQVDYPLQIGEAPATVTNSGMIYVSGGNLTVAQASFGASFVNSGNISIEAGRRVDINGGFFIPSSGIISSSMVGQGQFYVNSATVASGTISDSAVVVMTNSRTGGLLYNDGTIHARGSCTFDGRFENQFGGTILVEAVYGAHADLKVANGPDFKNYGEIQLTTNTTAGYTSQMSIPGDTWINNGTVRSHAGANGGWRTITGPLDNQGTIQVDYPLQIDAGLATTKVTNNGLIKIADGINFQFTSGLFNPGTGTIEGVFNLSPTASLGSGTLSGTGRMVLANGTIRGPLVNRGLLVTHGNTRINGNVENQAEGVILIEAVYGAHANLEVVNGPAFKNYGEIRLTTNTAAGYTTKLSITGDTWINNGTVRSHVGANGGWRVISGPLDNQGIFQVDYPLRIEEAADTLTNNGTINVAGGKTLTVSGTSSFVNHIDGVLQGSGTLIIENQIFFTNEGQINPGSAVGTLSITGNIEQTPTGRIGIEIGGTVAGTGYDQLKVSGKGDLGGTLNVSFANNYVPQPGDSYQIITYGSYTGAFSSITPPIASGNRDWNISYTPTGVQLGVIEAGAGLRLLMSDHPDPITLFHELTYTLTVVNGGSVPATNVSLTDVLPSSALFASATASQGSCLHDSGTVTCALGDFAPEGYATVTITVVPTFISAISNTASVTSDAPDTNQDDNTYTISSTVKELPGGYDIGDSPIGLGVTGLSSSYYGNTSGAQITVSGIGFDSQTVIYLVAADGTIYYPESFVIDSLFQATLSFDFSQVPIGRYNVVVANGTDQYELANSFEVVETEKPKLETRLVLPGSLGRHVAATLYVEYKNTGNVAMPAPLLRLVSADADNSDKPILTLDKARLIQNFWSPTMPAGTAHSVQFLANGDDAASPGILQPGESGRVPVYYLGMLQPWTFSDSQVEFEIRIINGEEPTSYGWAERKDAMKPATMEQAAWDIIFANLASGVGETWGDYITFLAENSAYLYRHAGKKVSDPRKLMQFELLQAMGHSPIPYLAGGTDISVEAPGLPLSFGSLYKNSIASRHTSGPLGKGWTHNWQMSVAEETNGEVVFTYMNNRLRYTRDSRGGYFPPAGNHTKLSKSGDIFTITTAKGVKIVFNANGTLNSIEDLNGNRITAEYSGNLLTRLVHSAGPSLSLSYSGGFISSITDNTGELSVLYSYAGDNLVAMQDVYSRTTHYTYHQSGPAAQALAMVRLPDATENYFAYDANGRLSELNFNGNPPITIAYDSGTVNLTDTADQSVSQYYYDEVGSFIKYRDPLGHLAFAQYDNNSNLTGLLQPDGHASAFVNDDKGNLVRTIDQLRQMTRFGYGDYNRLTFLSDAETRTTQYQYDDRGNNTARISPDLTTQVYTRDAAGKLTGKTNRRGTPVNIVRNTRGQVTHIDYNDNTSVHYTYDDAGNVLSVEDRTGIITMDYYPNHLLRRITYPDNRSLEYTYDAAGRRTSATDQNGYRLDYTYNFDGKLERITANDITTPVRYEYDSKGRLSKRILGNGVATAYQYDAADRILLIATADAAGTPISSFAYEYDALDRRTKETSRDGVWAYTYDATGQLTHAVFTSNNPDILSRDIAYVYDKVGNRVAEIVNGASASYAVNSMNQYSQAGGFSYSYDPDGNLTGKTDGTDTWSYEYNDDNRLIRSAGPDEVKEYIYNGLGQLATVIENGVEKHYLVDPFGFGNVVGEYDDAGNMVSRYTHGYGLVGKDENYYTFDGNGNTSELTDATGVIVNFYVYEPFGTTLDEVETTDNAFRFVGQFGIMKMADDLLYMRNRFYMPSTGRFMAEDPIGLAGGDVNFNRYVQNNPVNLVDPEGLRIITMPTPFGPVPFPIPGPVEPISVPIPDLGLPTGDGTIDGSDWDEFGIKNDPIGDAFDDADEDAPAVPDTCEEPPKKTCQEIYAETGIAPCEEYVVDYGYFYDSKNEAIEYLRSNGYSNVTCQESGAEAYSGPCAYEDGGRHYNCTSNGTPIHSIMSCPCCDETGGSAEITDIWKVGN
ncbi:MAG: RHS repeat-associated core domain-containing protein [Desulfobulbaceae bacterium]